MKKVVYLLIVLMAFFAVGVNAEIKECSIDNYNKIDELSFEDKKEITIDSVSNNRASIEEGMLIIDIDSKNDPLMNVKNQYRFDETTFKSVGGYYTVQGSGLFIVYALSDNGVVYRSVVDYREADSNSSYKPELKETELTNIEHISTPDENDGFYLIEKPEAAPHRAVYAIDGEGNIYTDETMDNNNFCKIANQNSSLGEAVTEESTESTEKANENILKQSIEVPIYIVAILVVLYGIIIGFLLGRIKK